MDKPRITISFKEIEQAVGEWDFAMRAASYGANGNRDVTSHAIHNLPTEELEKLRPFLANLIKEAVARTAARITELGVIMDVPHPPSLRSSLDVGSYFYKKDRQ